MSRVLEDLQPCRVFHYFEEICGIPHGSGNTGKISDYCINFALEHKLKYQADEMGNIIIFKDASSGREQDGGVILQGHLDMVNVKKNESKHDFEYEGLELVVDGDYVYAKDTTLGGDDGIAVAYALAILESDTISHPALEVILTVDEEIGLLGAAGIDISGTKSKYMINIDSDADNVLWAGCAGGMTSVCKIPLSKECFTGIRAIVKVSGLRGGHSGGEIDKERGNACIMLGRVLYNLKRICLFSIYDISGGLKDNAIPREAKATIILDMKSQYFVDESALDDASNDYKKTKLNDISEMVFKMNQMLKEEYLISDNDVSVSIEIVSEQYEETYDNMSTEQILLFLMNVPNGVQNMSKNIEGLVETSLNLGVLKIEEDTMIAHFSVRSSVESRKKALGDRLKYLTEFIGGDYSYSGDYPEWNFKVDSTLRSVMSGVYKKLFGETPQIAAIHAGLECGYFSEKRPELDIISCGPNIFDIHTTEERISILSVEKVYKFLIEVLKEIK